MRIVFEFRGKPQVATSGSAYSLGPVRKRPRWNGCQAEMVIEDTPKKKQRTSTEDVLYLEGDVESLRTAFRLALKQLELLETSERDAANAIIARSIKCPMCRTWHDPDARWHADGKGSVCQASRYQPD